ncbi:MULTISPECIES: fumarylacetoacetate hydrolase family protein [unclassified Streptomyces]|uniref:fumarylacetoacetate hydrolase family protein n=1 Tax=unclassified Streptomyces TaxID=2593676 RepID=UPI00225B8995|nr:MULTISPECIES: fumarylacetoacetate hydrolase family protein [unclassified Streptomyces]MCX5435606.1 fumarylacetoacetate hydrolase family protein [Streptomyces sp. NBC_00063]WSE08861.1 fumarylacetoacetate hydrolase family protein [Streptomyces sp. NBC_01445]WSE13403.1 fumarylacetoacetate hydrolase family protein [Streptomyces sp. NBC_01397]WUB97680.1 fumarylacetoacetate hydrolase family protein [Streptomyces sp. NBC_00569]
MSTTPFSLGTFAEATGSPFPGIVVDGKVYDTRTVLPEAATTRDLLADWEAALEALQSLADAPEAGLGRPVGDLRVLAPVQPPGQIIAAGANYREHVIQITVAHRLGKADATPEELREQAAREVDERRANGDPYVWVGAPSAINGPYDDVVLPSLGENHDWELELGVIIGREAREVSPAEALDHVAGYTICNDMTTRSLVPRPEIPMMGTDWMRSKNQPGFYPTGPYVVPARFVSDPQDLDITLKLNGKVMQKGNTGDMIFDIASLISYASHRLVLQPGDMLITGSPEGNGSHYGRFLRAGDVMESEITGLGTQRTVCS